MKAKEYAAQYFENQTEKELSKIILSFVKEISILINKRNAKSNSACISIIDEIIHKFDAFARRVKDKKPDFEIDKEFFINILDKLQTEMMVAYRIAKEQLESQKNYKSVY